RYDGEAEGLPEFNHRSNDGAVVRVLGDPADQALVDLQLVQAQLPEMLQRGEAAPEVVDGQCDPRSSEPVDRSAHLTGVLDDLALGDLHDQLVGDARVADAVQDLIDERPLVQVAHADVDGCLKTDAEVVPLPKLIDDGLDGEPGEHLHERSRFSDPEYVIRT